MKKIYVPEHYNYIGVFLTLRCNLGCDYCINHFSKGMKDYEELSGDEWIQGLSRIVAREDLPLSLQGGEPTMHSSFYHIASNLDGSSSYMDLLTNGLFDIDEFIHWIHPGIFQRDAPYASIRFSFHRNTNMIGLMMKVIELQRRHYSVGIWGLRHPDMIEKNKEMQDLCRWTGIDYREKDYLDKDHGTYKYPESVSGIKQVKPVLCKPSELLIAPDGGIYGCHSDLYAGVNSVGNLLEDGIRIEESFRACNRYGLCNPCDTKIKTNRFQEDGHTSVTIKE